MKARQVRARPRWRRRISKSRLNELRQAAAFLKKLHRHLERVGLMTRRTDRLAYDLAHIHWIFTTFHRRLNTLTAVNGTRRGRLAALNDIRIELYFHLPYHLKMLRRPLNRVITRLESHSVRKLRSK